MDAPSRTAIIGVHVRSTILLSKMPSIPRSAALVFSRAGFAKCVQSVRNLSTEKAGYMSSRVYVGADNPGVRKEALSMLGEGAMVPPPGYVLTANEREGHMTTMRNSGSTIGALDEILLLARADALIVWNLVDSTYSAVAASWATHGAEGHAARPPGRPWLASSGCS